MSMFSYGHLSLTSFNIIPSKYSIIFYALKIDFVTSFVFMLSGRSFSRSMSIRLDFLRSKASSSLQLLDVGLLESPVRLRREFFLWRGRLKEKKF